MKTKIRLVSVLAFLTGMLCMSCKDVNVPRADSDYSREDMWYQTETEFDTNKVDVLYFVSTDVLSAEELSAAPEVSVFFRERDDGIAEDHRIGAGALLIHLVAAVGVDLIVRDAAGAGQMAARGKAQNGKLVGDKAPLFRMGADIPDRPQSVTLRLGIMMLRSHPVLQYECMEAERIEGPGDRGSLMIGSRVVTTAWKHQNAADRVADPVIEIFFQIRSKGTASGRFFILRTKIDSLFHYDFPQWYKKKAGVLISRRHNVQ